MTGWIYLMGVVTGFFGGVVATVLVGLARPRRPAPAPVPSLPLVLGVHTFTLVVEGVQDLDSTVIQAMNRAGCEDASGTWYRRNNRLELLFSRRALTRLDAVEDAIRQVRKMGVGTSVRLA